MPNGIWHKSLDFDLCYLSSSIIHGEALPYIPQVGESSIPPTSPAGEYANCFGTADRHLRIYVKDGDGSVYCNAQLLDLNNAVPIFMVNLPLFDSLGRLLDVGAYLPLEKG